jgi:PAS domain S-box-containing protein
MNDQQTAKPKTIDELAERVKVRTAELTTANEQLRHEIEERKRTEEALRQSRDELQALIDACPDAVVMSDLTGKVLYASKQTWNLLGLPDQVELRGRSVFDYVVEVNQRRLQESIPTLIEVGVRRHTEYTARRLDGTTVPTEVSSAVIRDVKSQPRGVMAVIRDITERKQADEALRQEHRTLKHLLQSSDHERQVIAYEIHDGLAQQLAGAIMQLDAYSYQKDIKPKEAAKAIDAAVTILRQAHFDARRLISGVRPPILDESGVVTAIAHLVNENRIANGPTIEFHSEVEFNRLAPIVENAIYRIAQEGLANACQHSKSKRIRVELVQQGHQLRIKIQDWGIGFDPAEVEENRFGLAGIRERARLLGGHTTMESAPKQGTCLAVELPLVARE